MPYVRKRLFRFQDVIDEKCFSPPYSLDSCVSGVHPLLVTVWLGREQMLPAFLSPILILTLYDSRSLASDLYEYSLKSKACDK